MPPHRPDVGFLVQDVLGFRTYLDNLRIATAEHPEVAPVWLPVGAEGPAFWGRLPPSLVMAVQGRRVLKRNDAHLDALLVCAQNVGMLSIDLLRRVPSVISTDATGMNFNEVVAGYGREAPGSLGERIKTRWHRAVYRAARRVIAWSDWTAHSIVTDYDVPAERVRVVRPGIDLDRWEMHDRSARSGTVRALFVGGAFDRKGGPELVTALRSEALRDVELDVVSNDPAVSASDRVRVHRGLEPNSIELRRLFAEADLFVLPSLGDASPWVLLEAMASGLPVVSTELGAIPEAVRHGETGLLVAPGDVHGLVSTLVRLMEDPDMRLTFGRAGRARVEEHFDGARTYPTTVQIMREVAEEGRAS